MTDTFKASYGVLQKHAQTLRQQTEPNIDDLLSIVEESVAAYKVCQARIDAVEAALEKALNNAKQPADEPAQGSQAAKTSGASTATESEDDIPF